MSKARRIADSERTSIMTDILHRRHMATNGNARAYVVLEEVAPGTGWMARRWSDALVLSVWPSNGLTLEGYEVKASREDLKRELADPDKHQATARFCDSWNLVVWDEGVMKGLTIPEGWGLWIVEGDDDSGRGFKCLRKAAKLTPEPWPRSFICSMVRNAYEQSPGAEWVARVTQQVAERSYDQGKREGRRQIEALFDPICVTLFGKDRWKWQADARDPESLLKLINERLTQLPLEATTS